MTNIVDLPNIFVIELYSYSICRITIVFVTGILCITKKNFLTKKLENVHNEL